jgi:hypothetical protein
LEQVTGREQEWQDAECDDFASAMIHRIGIRQQESERLSPPLALVLFENPNCCLCDIDYRFREQRILVAFGDEYTTSPDVVKRAADRRGLAQTQSGLEPYKETSLKGNILCLLCSQASLLPANSNCELQLWTPQVRYDRLTRYGPNDRVRVGIVLLGDDG